MLKNYLITAWRNMFRNRIHSLIMVGGLAIGLASCMLISMYVSNELSYDANHPDKDRIFRVVQSQKQAGEWYEVARSPAPLAPTLQQEFPQIEAATRVVIPGEILLETDHYQSDQHTGIYADSNFCEIFDLTWLAGNPREALRDPSSIVITQSLAKTLFGLEDPMGKTIVIEKDRPVQVAGVIINIPQKTHLPYEFIVSLAQLSQLGLDFNNWSVMAYYSYVKLRSPEIASELSQPLSQYMFKKMQWQDVQFYLQPLEDIYLKSKFDFQTDIGPRGNIEYVYGAILIAAVILVLACINFVNLSVSKATQRAKEIGIRKSTGAQRAELMLQFVIEATLIIGLSFIMAVTLVQVFTTTFETLIGSTLSSQLYSIQQIGIACSILLFTILLCGGYPAFVLASYQPKDVFQQTLKLPGGINNLSKGLVTFQFAIAILLIGATLIIFAQLSYLRQKNLGLHKDQIAYVRLKGNLKNQYPHLKSTLYQLPAIDAVTGTNFYSMPFLRVGSSTVQNLPGNYSGETFNLSNCRVDYDFVETLGLELITGRSFSTEYASDSAHFILNETAVKKMGLKQPIGMRFNPFGDGEGIIIGVVKDFHYSSLQESINPLVFRLRPQAVDYLLVRSKEAAAPQFIKALQNTLDQFSPDYPYEIQWLEETYANTYRAEFTSGSIIRIFSLIAICLACMGLLGLIIHTHQRKIKEIGIRKVLGASIAHLVLLLIKQYLLMIGLACLISIPLLWWGIQRWLTQYAYQMPNTYSLVLLPGIIALCIACITISFYTIRAANVNPIYALREE